MKFNIPKAANLIKSGFTKSYEKNPSATIFFSILALGSFFRADTRKLESDIRRLEIDEKKLIAETEELKNGMNELKADTKKLRAETKVLKNEMNRLEYRIMELEAERSGPRKNYSF